MKLQIIETPDYILAISDEEIKVNDYCIMLDSFGNLFSNVQQYTNPETQHLNKGLRKVIAYQPKGNAPELNLPLLPEIIVEDDVEKLAESCAKEAESIDIPYQNGLFYGFIKGHKAATKKYSEDDVIKAVKFFASYIASTNRNVFDKDILLYLNAFKQPKTPKWFVAEKEKPSDSFGSWVKTLTEGNTMLKTTTINNKTYLVGKYLNE